MKYNKSMAETLAEMRKVKEQETDPVQKAQDNLQKARKIADLKKQIDTVKKTEMKEDGHVDVASAVRHCKTIIEDCNDIMSKLNSMGEQPLPSWLTDKITVAADDLNGARDYLMNPQTEEKEDDINEVTITIKSYDTKTGLDRQAEKQLNKVATRAGAKVKKSGNNVYKLTGNGKQISKFMSNIDQIDGSFMTEESEFMTEFTSSQIKRLKKEYEPLRGKHHTELQPARFTQLRKMMMRMGKPQLQALVKADIPILSSAAKASLVVNHGMKFSSIKEELIPYLDIFPLDEEKKSKFKSVEPQVINRIQKMMKGSREEKNSIAMMMNYLMPPEVVDMVRDKLKITAKRGKIKF
jgi:hypothetical protein